MCDFRVLSALLRRLPLAIMLACATAAVWATSKGPDAGGYSGTDATVYSFVDIAGGSGGVSVLAGTDDSTATLTLPFAFQFYGQAYTLVCVSSNGAMYFVTGEAACTGLNDFANTDLSVVGPPGDHPAVLPLWSDLTFQVAGADAVYYQVLGSSPNRRFVVQWNNAYPQGSQSPVTFQVILSEGSSSILFQYKNVTLGAGNHASNGAESTIGIRNREGVNTQQQVAWSFGAPVVVDHTALLFSKEASTPPNQPPSLSLPADITREATSAAGAAVSYAAGATDPEDGALTAACVPASGSTFPLGTTTVQCSATDSRGATATGGFAIAVRDSTPPVVSPPSAITIPATESGGARASASPALATYLVDGSAVDVVDPAPSRLAAQVAGADANTVLFPVGKTTTVTFRFKDASGNLGTATSTVTVMAEDSGTPKISIRIAAHGVVSGNRKYVDLDLSNTGTGAAREITLRLLLLIPTKGIGLPKLVSPTLPLNLGALDAGSKTTFRVVFDAPRSVQEISIVEVGTFRNSRGTLAAFLEVQAFAP